MPRGPSWPPPTRAHAYACARRAAFTAFLGGLTALASGHGSAAAQTPTRKPDPVPDLGTLLEDADGDLVPDRVGQLLQVRGFANMASRMARDGDDGAWYFVTIQDATGGVRLLTRSASSLSGIRSGDEVVASGELTQRRGTEELLLHDLRRTGARAPVVPRRVLARDVAGEGQMHRLVRLEGTIVRHDPEAHLIVVHDSTGVARIRATRRLTSTPRLSRKLEAGGRIEVVGIVGQSDLEPPFDDGYRVAPRTPQDFAWAPLPPIHEIVMGLAILALVMIVAFSVLLRRRALRRAGALEELTAELEASRSRAREAARKFQALFEDDSIARFVLDGDRRVRTWNRALESLCDRAGTDIEGRTLDAIGVQEEARAAVEEPATNGDETTTLVTQKPVVVRTPTGSDRVGLLTLDRAGREEHVIGSIVDVTRRAELEARLARSQKMEALGQLAGGVAHDINNMLAAILGNTDLVLEEASADASVSESLAEIRHAAVRASRLTRQLLTVARRDIVQPTTLDLDEVVRDMTPMLQRVLGKDVEVATLLADRPSWIRADLSQMEQILLNLATNAREAMPDGGTLSMEIEHREDGIGLRVSDDGLGMEPAVLGSVFDPFFTTKPHGTGLGLATVHGIVSDMGGTIGCTSRVGEGTTFDIVLPRAEPDAAVTTSRPAAGTSSTDRAATVLLAEDEAAVRTVARRILQKAGHRVVEAANGDEALRILRRSPARFDVLLTDLVMPILGGKELARDAAAVRPDLPVVFMSGYVDEADAQRHVQGSRFFLHKPFVVEDLVSIVTEALESAGESEPGSARPALRVVG